jgi:hypothetical protein
LRDNQVLVTKSMILDPVTRSFMFCLAPFRPAVYSGGLPRRGPTCNKTFSFPNPNFSFPRSDLRPVPPSSLFPTLSQNKRAPFNARLVVVFCPLPCPTSRRVRKRSLCFLFCHLIEYCGASNHEWIMRCVSLVVINFQYGLRPRDQITRHRGPMLLPQAAPCRRR